MAGVPIWFLLLCAGIVMVFIYLYEKKKPKDEKYKQIDLEREIKRDLKETFELTKENIGYGKRLYIGSRLAGFVLKAITLNYYEEDLGKSLKKKKITEKFPEATQVTEEVAPKTILYGFEVCGKSRLNRALANLLGLGVSTYLVDKDLVKEQETTFNVNPYSQPTKYLSAWIFSKYGQGFLENLTYKFADEQKLQKFVNWLPELTYFEHNQAKQNETLNMMEEVNKAKRDEFREQIKKS